MSKQFVIGSAEWVEVQRSGSLDARPPIPATPEPANRIRPRERRIFGEGLPCTYCKREMIAWTELHPTKDHIVPASRGGRDTVPCCYQCNQMKGDAMPDEWEAFMLANPSWWLTGRQFRPGPPAAPTPWVGVCPAMLACSNSLFYERYKHRGVFKFW